MQHTYRLREGLFEAQKWRMVVRTGVFFAAAMGVALAIGGKVPSGPVAVVWLAVVAFAAIFGVRLALRRAREALTSYELIVTDGSITRRMSAHSDIVLVSGSVVTIEETSKAGLIIRGPSLSQTIFVPPELVGLSELREVLASWHPIKPHVSRVSSLSVSIMAVAATFVLMYASFAVNVRSVAIPASVLLAIGLAWCVWYIRRCPHYDHRFRRTAWVGLLPALVGLVRAAQLLFS